MQSVPRRQWIEFLEDLEIDGEVRVSSRELEPSTEEGWTVRSAGFDPFDHLIEVVLDNHEVTVRVLLEDPQAIAFDGPSRAPQWLHITTPEGDFEMNARTASGR